jgi:hypothetical protein
MAEEDDYEKNFTNSDEMEFLTETNEIRIEEEMTRPRVEIWPYDEWQAWIASHERKRLNMLCHIQAMKASPFCAMGYH